MEERRVNIKRTIKRLGTCKSNDKNMVDPNKSDASKATTTRRGPLKT